MEKSPSEPPPAGSRAQAGPVGYMLVVGMTLVAAIGIVVFGAAVIQGSQGDAQKSQAELALTQFDSKAAQVALDESDVQTISLGSGGDYRVNEDEGAIRIYHDNWSDGAVAGDKEWIYGDDNTWKPLGSVVYENGDTMIAYQAGGVWRKDGEGSTMVSPPEFQYRGSTLTFPIIRVTGDQSGSGDIKAHVTKDAPTRDVYPHPNREYDGGSGPPYINPIANGTMTVEVKSEYCQGWQAYFEDRTEGEVTECTDNGVVTAELKTLGSQGNFDPWAGNDVPVRGQEEDGIEDFSVTLRPQDSEASEFNNMMWSMSAQEGDQQFEISVQANGKAGDPVTVSIYYSEDNGENYDGWQNDEDFIIEEDGDTVKVTVDFLDDNQTEMTELAREDVEEFYPNQGELNEDPPNQLEDPDTLKNVTQYYFYEMGEMDIQMNEGNNANLGDGSEGTLVYEGDGSVVTFLHVTENEVEVKITN